MTAVSTIGRQATDSTLPLRYWGVASDAELVAAAAAGDRGAFAGIYDRYADRLHHFCLGMVRDRDLAADCVQEVFCTAAAILSQLRDPHKLRPWLYSIARREALRSIRRRRREEPSDQVPETASEEAGPDTLAARSELADLIAAAAGGVSDRDRALLELSYRHALDTSEVADALDISYESAKKMLQRLRETIERSLGALLVARGAMHDPRRCRELAVTLEGWDGQFTVLMRKRIARHIEACQTCEHQRRQVVNPVALLGAVPVFIPAPDWLRGHTLAQIQLTPAPSSPTPSAGISRTRGLLSMGAKSAAALITSAALTFTWLHYHHTSITPTDVTTTTPQTNVAAASPPATTTSDPPPGPSATPTPPLAGGDMTTPVTESQQPPAPVTTPQPPPAPPTTRRAVTTTVPALPPPPIQAAPPPVPVVPPTKQPINPNNCLECSGVPNKSPTPTPTPRPPIDIPFPLTGNSR